DLRAHRRNALAQICPLPLLFDPDPKNRSVQQLALVAIPGAGERAWCALSPVTDRSGRRPERGAESPANSPVAFDPPSNATSERVFGRDRSLTMSPEYSCSPGPERAHH